MNQEKPFEQVATIDKKDIVVLLDEMIANYERLPQNAMSLPITHYDHYSLLLLLASFLKST